MENSKLVLAGKLPVVTGPMSRDRTVRTFRCAKMLANLLRSLRKASKKHPQKRRSSTENLGTKVFQLFFLLKLNRIEKYGGNFLIHCETYETLLF